MINKLQNIKKEEQRKGNNLKLSPTRKQSDTELQSPEMTTNKARETPK